jgi:hypothetical protein
VICDTPKGLPVLGWNRSYVWFDGKKATHKKSLEKLISVEV